LDPTSARLKGVKIEESRTEAEDHFERQLAIPQIRLRDWAAAE
jgi:hypothetical protein